MIGGADDHGFDVLLVQHLAPVPIGLGLGEDRQGLLGAVVVDVAQGDHVLVAQDVIVGGAPAPNAHQGDIQLVAGGVLPAKRAAFQDVKPGGGGRGLKQVTSLHFWWPPTVVPMMSVESLSVQVFSGEPSSLVMLKSTAKTPKPALRKWCSKVYHPVVVIENGSRPGFLGKAPLRVALLLALITKRGPEPVASESL